MALYIFIALKSDTPLSPRNTFRYPPFSLIPLLSRLPGKIKKIMRDLYLLPSGKFWCQITLMEELVEEVRRVVPNRGARDGNEPPTNRHGQKRNRRVRKDKRRFGKGSRMQRGRTRSTFGVFLGNLRYRGGPIGSHTLDFATGRPKLPGKWGSIQTIAILMFSGA